MAAKAIGCDPIIGVDLNPERLAIATELGATDTIDPNETDDLLWRVQELAAPGLHYSFDAVGAGPVIRQALESLRSPGHCVTVGFQGLENEITIDQGHLLLRPSALGSCRGRRGPADVHPAPDRAVPRRQVPVRPARAEVPVRADQRSDRGGQCGLGRQADSRVRVTLTLRGRDAAAEADRPAAEAGRLLPGRGRSGGPARWNARYPRRRPSRRTAACRNRRTGPRGR